MGSRVNGNKYFGTKLQPVTQFGRVSGLMPLNESSKPYGIITDIIGTGGSRRISSVQGLD